MAKIKTITAAEVENPENAPRGKKHYCTLVKAPVRVFAPEVAAHREAMILVSSKKWVNGTQLKYYFFNGGNDGSPVAWKGDATQQNMVKQAFQTWKNLGIGLTFTETNDKNEAQIRIGFMHGADIFGSPAVWKCIDMAAMSSSRSDLWRLHFRHAQRIRFQLLSSDPTGTNLRPMTCSFVLVRPLSRALQ